MFSKSSACIILRNTEPPCISEDQKTALSSASNFIKRNINDHVRKIIARFYERNPEYSITNQILGIDILNNYTENVFEAFETFADNRLEDLEISYGDLHRCLKFCNCVSRNDATKLNKIIKDYILKQLKLNETTKDLSDMLNMFLTEIEARFEDHEDLTDEEMWH